MYDLPRRGPVRSRESLPDRANPRDLPLPFGSVQGAPRSPAGRSPGYTLPPVERLVLQIGNSVSHALSLPLGADVLSLAVTVLVSLTATRGDARTLQGSAAIRH